MSSLPKIAELLPQRTRNLPTGKRPQQLVHCGRKRYVKFDPKHGSAPVNGRPRVVIAIVEKHVGYALSLSIGKRDQLAAAHVAALPPVWLVLHKTSRMA
jgi:hypothetical protein